jgi:hypothetical protein
VSGRNHAQQTDDGDARAGDGRSRRGRADGGVTGKVNVVSEAGSYSADFKSMVFDGTKATAAYDFPLDPSAEVVMTATFDGAAAKGTWSLRAKGQTDEIVGGGIAIAKK